MGCIFAGGTKLKTVEQTVLVEIPRKKSSYNAIFNTALPLLFIGELLQFNETQKFELNGVEINVPGLTANNDAKLRTFSVLMQVVKAMFEKFESDQIAPEDSEVKEFVDALRDKGFAISHDSKAAVMEAVKIWLQVKKLAIQNHVYATRKLNIEKFVKIAEYRKQNGDLSKGIRSEVKRIAAN